MEAYFAKNDYKKLSTLVDTNNNELANSLYIKGFSHVNDCNDKIKGLPSEFYKDCEKKINNSFVANKPNESQYRGSHNAKHINPIYRTKEFFDLFLSLGYSISIHIITECSVIYRNKENKYIVLSGKVEHEKINTNSHKILLKCKNIAKETFTSHMHNFKLLDNDTSYYKYVNCHIQQKIQKTKINCIFHSIFTKVKTNESRDDDSKYMSNVVCKQKIVDFLFIITKKCFASVFDYQSMLVLKNKIYRYVYLNKTEYINGTELMRNIKISNMKIYKANMCESTDADIRSSFLSMMINLFENFYNIIINRFFYCTETAFLGNRYVFYLRPFWTKESQDFLDNHLANYTAITSNPNSNNISNAKRYKYGSNPKLPLCTPLIRLIPKQNKLRPITNLKQRNKLSNEKSVQRIIYNKLCELGYEKSKHALFDEIIAFGMKYQNKCIYTVKIDLANCFDSIPQKKLEEIVKQLSFGSHTHLRSYKVTNINLHGSVTRYHAKIDNTQTPFYEYCKNIHTNCDSIISDSFYTTLTKDEINKTILKALKDSLLYCRGSFYKQSRGIPQGSILSSSLCNLFLGVITEKYLSNFSDKSILLRYVDDYLFLTTNQNDLKLFFSGLQKLEKLNMKVNVDKIQSNFVMLPFLNINAKNNGCDNSANSQFATTKNQEHYRERTNYVNWCGLKVYGNKFAVKSIYDQSTHSTFSYVCDKPGLHLKNKIYYTLQYRLSNIFTYDNNNLLYQNCYEYLNFLYIRTYKYIREMPFIHKEFVSKIVRNGEKMMMNKFYSAKISQMNIYNTTIKKARERNQKLFALLDKNK